MKKIAMICLTMISSMMAMAQTTEEVNKMCCQGVDFLLMATDLAGVDSTTTMIDLSLQNPKLTTIPSEVFVAKNATYLNVSFNRVGIIPEELKEMENLQCLDLSGNHYLAKLPDFLNEMKSLKVIKMEDLSWPESKQEATKKQFPNILILF